MRTTSTADWQRRSVSHGLVRGMPTSSASDIRTVTSKSSMFAKRVLPVVDFREATSCQALGDMRNAREKRPLDLQGRTFGFGSWHPLAYNDYACEESRRPQGHPDRSRTADLDRQDALPRKLNGDVSDEGSD